MTGRTHGVNVGVIDMQTDSVGDPLRASTYTPANNFFAARVQKELSPRSNVGVMFVNRQATGGGASSDSWNRTWGADGRWGVNQNLTINGFVARTETPGATGGEHAFNGGIEYRNRVTRSYFDYTEVGADFNPEVGFLERPDAYRQISTGFFKNLRRPWMLEKLKMREYRPHLTYEGFWGFDGVNETGLLHFDHALDFESGNFLSPGLNVQHETLRVPFAVYAPTSRPSERVIVPAGDYTTPYFFLQSNTDRKRLVSGGLAWNYGGFLSGHQSAQAPTSHRPLARRQLHDDMAVDPQRHLAAGGRFRHQRRVRARHLQLHAAHQRPGPGAVQRPDGSLVDQPPLQPAADGGDRAVRGLQRHRGVQRLRSGESRVRHEVRAPVGRVPVARVNTGRAGRAGSAGGARQGGRGR